MYSRRSFVALAASALWGDGRKVRLGGPIFLKSADPAELAREHRRLGYSAAYCPAVTVQDTARIAAIRQEFKAQDVVIAEVGAWRNMLEADSAKRRQNLDYVCERLALADAIGARCCVNIAGSFNSEQWDAPDRRNLSREFFDATVENCRKVIDAVKPRETKFTIEMMPWSLPDGPDEYVKLIKAVDRGGLAVHMDVCNILNSPSRIYNNGAVIAECFRKLGRLTMSCHAKDLAWVRGLGVQLRETIPGRGEVDYAVYLAELSRMPHQAPLMLEHLKTPEEYLEGANYIRTVASKAGVELA